MKTKLRVNESIVGMVLAAVMLFAAGTASAATNTATDAGGGGVSLTASPAVTVLSTQLTLVKAVYSGNTCLASSDSDAACGGGNSTNVPTGTLLTFVIYVDNSTGLALTDVRFLDSIRDVTAGPDYFEFQPDTYAAGQGIRYATAVSGSTKAAIKTALGSGTILTNTVSGADIAGIDTAASPDLLSVGQPGNAALGVAATTTFAIEFNVIKR